MKKTIKKMELNRETVRRLTGVELRSIAGGFKTEECVTYAWRCGGTADCTISTCDCPPAPGGTVLTCFGGGCQTIVSQ